jgi:hypothetical protein
MGINQKYLNEDQVLTRSLRWRTDAQAYAGLILMYRSATAPNMDDRICQILSQITTLEDELRTAMQEREHKMFFTLQGKRIEFASAVKARHRALRMDFRREARAQTPPEGPVPPR